jgi:hypothetical protein
MFLKVKELYLNLDHLSSFEVREEAGKLLLKLTFSNGKEVELPLTRKEFDDFLEVIDEEVLYREVPCETGEAEAFFKEAFFKKVKRNLTGFLSLLFVLFLLISLGVGILATVKALFELAGKILN